MTTINKSDKEFIQEFLIALALLAFLAIFIFGFMNKESVPFSKKEYKTSLNQKLKPIKI